MPAVKRHVAAPSVRVVKRARAAESEHVPEAAPAEDFVEDDGADDDGADDDGADDDGADDDGADDDGADDDGADDDGADALAHAPTDAADDVLANAPTDQPAQKSSKYYKVPTSDELRTLRETEELFRSNVFKLQMDELLSEMRVPERQLEVLKRFLHRLKDIVGELEPSPPQPVVAAYDELRQRGVVWPFYRPDEVSNLKVAFEPPAAVHVVGSFLLQTYAKPVLNVNLAVTMPASLFQPKDHMNYRYHHKRAFFLATLVAALSQHAETADVTFAALNGDVSKPVAVLQPPSAKSGFVVRVLPMLPAGVFSLDRLGPTRNGVRAHFSDEKKAVPTPLYNHGVLEDMHFTSHLAQLHAMCGAVAGFRHAIVLGKVWLYQRNMSQAQGQVDGFLLSMIMLALVQQHRLSKHMSSYQLFKATLGTLATYRFEQDSMHFNGPAPDAATLAAHHSAYDAVLLDVDNQINLLARVSKGALSELQHEAQISFAALGDSTGADPFPALFLHKKSQLLQFDHVVSIPRLSDDDAATRPDLPFRTAHPDFLDAYVRAQRNIPRILLRGLGDRLRVARVYTSNITPWSIAQPPPAYELGEAAERRSLTIGLVLNAAEALRLVELGPSPEDADAVTRFQSLWGSKSELRRFKDGTIAEAVTFAVAASDRHLIVPKMVAWLLQRHFAIHFAPDSGIVDAASSAPLTDAAPVYLVNQADALVRLPQKLRFAPPLVTKSPAPISAAFETITAQLKALDGFPLDIVAVHGVSAGLRGTAVFGAPALDFAAFPPKPSAEDSTLSLPPYTPVHEAVMQVEHTTAWPDDLEAIVHALAAMYLRLAKLLREAHADAVCEATAEWLDVLRDGFVFRFRIHVPRRLALLEQQRHDEAGQHELAELKSMYEHTVRHAGSVRAFAQRHVFYAPAVRITHRWLAVHLLADDVSLELVECLVAHVFVPPAPLYTPPASGLAGFHRTLELLARHDFATSPIVADWTGDLTAADRDRFAKTFDRVRAAVDPNGRKGGPVVMALSSYDETGTVWSGERPSAVVLRRAREFARAGIERLASGLFSLWQFDYGSLFVTPLDEYDALLHLRNASNPRACGAVGAAAWLESGAYGGAVFKNLRAARVTSMPLVAFDPVDQLLRDLRREFGHLALFFHDTYGSNVIAVKWRPAVFDAQPFKVAHAYAMEPVQPGDTGRVAPRAASLLTAMRVLAGDIVERVS